MKLHSVVAAMAIAALPCSAAMAAETNLETAYKLCRNIDAGTAIPNLDKNPPTEKKAGLNDELYRYLCVAVLVLHDPQIQVLVNGILDPDGTTEPHKYRQTWQKFFNNAR